MIEIYYCTPSDFSDKGYATGSRVFRTYQEFSDWLETACTKGPVLITGMVRRR